MKRIAAAVAVVVVAAAPGARAGGAPIAVPVPDRRICAEGAGTILVGVRYTDNPPGARRYEVEVRRPGGRRVLHRRGLATRRWRFWRYDPPVTATGVYRTTYRFAWATHVFRTRVVACRR